MTFIASVAAKNGVALIADSLVTTAKSSMDFADFFDLIRRKQVENPDQDIVLKPDELIEIFRRTPSHTRDYEEKLFEYDKFTAITTAGGAIINDQHIVELVENIKKKNSASANRRSYSQKSIETKIKDFCSFISEEVKEHLRKHHSIGKTSFIFSHYDKNKHTTHVFRVWVNESDNSVLQNSDHSFVEYSPAADIEKVVCDGQNRITEGMLYGNYLTTEFLFRVLIGKIKEDLALEISDDYIATLKNEILQSPIIKDTVKMLKLTDLSLQEAVNLANLLMKVEIDFQKYTEDVPTVGGVIKIAVIDNNGFKFVAGHEITNPNGGII